MTDLKKPVELNIDRDTKVAQLYFPVTGNKSEFSYNSHGSFWEEIALGLVSRDVAVNLPVRINVSEEGGLVYSRIMTVSDV